MKGKMTSLGLFLTSALCLLPIALTQAQSTRDTPVPKSGSGLISGVVVTEEANSKPLRHAIISLASVQSRDHL
jgi:hypothetical protein